MKRGYLPLFLFCSTPTSPYNCLTYMTQRFIFRARCMWIGKQRNK